MTKILFDEVKNVLDRIYVICEDCSKTVSSCNNINVSKVAKISPAAEANHSEIKEKIKNISDLLDDYYSNCSSSIEKYESLYESIGVTIEGVNDNNLLYDNLNGIKDGTYLGDTVDGNMYYIMVDGIKCRVAKTKIDVFDYQNYLLANKITQNDLVLSGECLLFSKFIAADMMRGTFTGRKAMETENPQHLPTNALWDAIAPTCATNDMNSDTFKEAQAQIYDYVYETVSNGYPVVLQVSQTDSNGRHFVVINGFDDSVQCAEDLNPSTMLALDCRDAKYDFLSNCGMQEGGRTLRTHQSKLLVIGPSKYFIDTQINNPEWLQNRANNHIGANILNMDTELRADYTQVHPWN